MEHYEEYIKKDASLKIVLHTGDFFGCYGDEVNIKLTTRKDWRVFLLPLTHSSCACSADTL